MSSHRVIHRASRRAIHRDIPRYCWTLKFRDRAILGRLSPTVGKSGPQITYTARIKVVSTLQAKLMGFSEAFDIVPAAPAAAGAAASSSRCLAAADSASELRQQLADLGVNA